MAITNLQRAVEQGTMVSALLSHPGWRIVEQFLRGEREAAITSLLAKDSEADRATVNVVDGLTRRLTNLATAGKQAEKRLKGGK